VGLRRIPDIRLDLYVCRPDASADTLIVPPQWHEIPARMLDVQMIDIQAARIDPSRFRAALARKGAAEIFDQLMKADKSWLQLVPRVEQLRSRTRLKGKPTPEQLSELSPLKAELDRLEQELAEAKARREELLALVPNPPDACVPDGSTEEEAVELRRVGNQPTFSFQPRDHLELGQIDMERGARVSGSRFAYRIGDVALAELALYRLALDHVINHGLVPVLPPVLVREEAMFGTGFFPTDAVNIYAVERDGLHLTGTSEVALAALHQGEIISADRLPLRYAGYSTCFRREAGAAGKDTRGMFRVHQFDKVEMFVFCLPDQSGEEHERLLDIEESLIQALEIPYRVVNIPAGDLGASAAKKYDIEAWFPSQGRYREITSTSNTTDFQARRLDIRTRARDGKLHHVHTLNGTAVTARALLAVLENFQDQAGPVVMPEALVHHGAPRRVGRPSG
jgi:seryl-tRNA synthetase